MAWHRPVVGLGRAFADHDLRCNELAAPLPGPGPLDPATLARFAHTPPTPVLAHLDLAYRPPGRWLRERFSWTHYQGTRSGAGSRSAQDSTSLPTVDPFGARDGDPSSALRVLTPTRRPVERSAHQHDPPRSGEARRWRPASLPSGGWHASGRATALPWPDKPHHDHGSTRYAATHVRSSMRNDQCDGRSPAPQHPAHEEWRSLPAPQKTEPHRVSRRAFYLTPASGAGVCS